MEYPQIHEVSPDYEDSLRTFIRSSRETDQRKRIAHFILLFSAKEKLAPANNLLFINDDDWATLLQHASNYLRSSTESDWQGFSELYNRLAQNNI